MSEDQLQARCYQWLHNHHPELRGYFFAVPNGGHRNKIEAMKLKATGVVPGIPDCVLVWPVTAGFEFKTKDGRVSIEQAQIHQKWAASGLVVYVIREFGIFEGLIREILKQNKTK